MRKRLPSLFSLQVFEAAARLGTFSRAAAELHLTQGAISRQIRQLEAWTGRTLFHRHGPQISVAPAGHALLARLSAPLDALHEAVYPDDVLRQHTLQIATLASIARAIILPRILAFQEMNADVQLTIHTDYALSSLPPHAPAVAIRFGLAPPPNLHNDLLFGDRLVAVAAPAVANKVGLLPENWPRNAMLRHVAEDWSVWLNAAGCAKLEPYGMAFNDASILLNAAESGGGIALTRLTLAWDALQDNRLRCISPISVAAPRSHYFLCRPEILHSPGVARFHEWILKEAHIWRTRLAEFSAARSQ